MSMSKMAVSGVANKTERIAQHIQNILNELGYKDDPQTEETASRVAKEWTEELLAGQAPPPNLFKTFEEEHDQMIVLSNHTSWTRCPHHLERVQLILTIAYIPDGRVLGLSKLARIADFYAKGLRLQETYTDTLADALYGTLKPLGVGVHCKGIHHCMKARGIKTQGHVTTTALRGVFLEDPAVRAEFLQYAIQQGG